VSDGIRVALLHPTYWPEVRRGGERIVRELASGLIARGHEPRLVTSHPGRPSRTVEDGLPVTRQWRPPERLLRRRGFVDYLTHVPLSYASLAAGRDQVAHALYPTDALAAARWSRRTGRPSILGYTGLPHQRGLAYQRLRAEVAWRAARECSAVTVLSRAAADGFRRWLGIESARVIYPSVDLEVFRPGPGRSAFPLIYCGAAAGDARKRVDLLLRALPLVLRERPDARLLLPRPDDPEVAARLEAAEGVELHDQVADPADMAPIYRRAWVSALTSFGEAFGLVLAEALACGTPVVGSRLGAIPEIVDRDDVGRLFDGDDERDVARALLEALELAQDPSTPAACRARAEEFSPERMAIAHEELYTELLER
jgi:glycosyltransferase involved in cell wall biosynthesis